ncbi:MAG: NHL repeat-containing protein [Mucilaginibacter sp.]
MKAIYYPLAILTATLTLLSSCSKKAAVTPTKPKVLTVTTLAGNGTAGLLNGTGTAAEFHQASDLAISTSGDLYVGDWLNNVVRKINLTSSVVTTFAGTGAPGFTNGTSTTATFNGIAHVAFDKSGNLLITDEQNNSIREVTTSGNVITIAGRGTAGYVDGPAATAAFNTPGNLVVDANGDIYVADTGNQVIRKITISTGIVSTYAGTGVRGLANGDKGSATFSSPYGIGISPGGDIFVADAANNVVRKITVSTGKVTTFAGTGAQGLTNGTALSATFFHPGALTFDTGGNIFVSELGNNTIRKITTDGTVSTYAGTGAAGSIDGDATSATFQQPNGLAFDSSGNLYVADQLNNIIRKIALQ